MSASSPEYRELISRICDLEPHFGWSSPEQIPPLSREDVALVIAKHETDVLEECEFDLADLVRYLTGSNPIGQLGLCLNRVLEKAAREAIWLDVNEESERREEENRPEARRESEASRCGVATLFKGSHL